MTTTTVAPSTPALADQLRAIASFVERRLPDFASLRRTGDDLAIHVDTAKTLLAYAAATGAPTIRRIPTSGRLTYAAFNGTIPDACFRRVGIYYTDDTPTPPGPGENVTYDDMLDLVQREAEQDAEVGR